MFHAKYLPHQDTEPLACSLSRAKYIAPASPTTCSGYFFAGRICLNGFRRLEIIFAQCSLDLEGSSLERFSLQRESCHHNLLSEIGRTK